MNNQAFFKMSPHGPEGVGLTRRPPYPKENLETEPPVHSSHLYVNDEGQGIKIGVWECTPHTSKMGPFPVNEFMILLEGSVKMLDTNGKSTIVRAGEAFVVPKGAVCQWNQSEPVRKFFAIQGDAPGKPRPDASRPQPVTKASPAAGQGQAGHSSERHSALPFGAGEAIYSDTARGYLLGNWNKLTENDRPFVSQSYQVLRVEAGTLTLDGGEGSKESIKPGETVLVMPGYPITWSGSDDLRVLACSIMDESATALPSAAA